MKNIVVFCVLSALAILASHVVVFAEEDGKKMCTDAFIKLSEEEFNGWTTEIIPTGTMTLIVVSHNPNPDALVKKLYFHFKIVHADTIQPLFIRFSTGKYSCYIDVTEFKPEKPTNEKLTIKF